MSISQKTASVAVILALVGIVAVAVHRHHVKQATAASQLYNDAVPIPKGAARISAAVLRQLTSSDFTVVTDLRYLPAPVKESFCNVEDCNYASTKFDMVNPGETMSTDYILPGVPNKRLILCCAQQGLGDSCL